MRLLTEDRRLANMAKVARFRIGLVEPLALKPPDPRAGHRLARVVAYDYAAARAVEALIDLTADTVAHLQISGAQPALGPVEEAAAISVAGFDAEVQEQLGLGDEVQGVMHYWSRRESELAFSQRSAVVMFGQAGARPSLLVVVDLIDGQVTDVVAAEEW